MKSLIRTVLWSSFLLVPVTACGDKPSAPADAAKAVVAPRAPHDPQAAMPPSSVTVVEPKPVVAVVTPKTYAEALALGIELSARGEQTRARELLEAAARFDRSQPDPHVELARLFIARGERGLAIRSANKAVKLAPNSSQAFNTLGRAELLRHNYERALRAFRKATVLNPDNVWAWNNLGYTHLERQDYREAIEALVEATTRKGTAGYMWNNLGLAYEQLDELDDARDAFERGALLGSNEAKASRRRLEGVETILVAAEAGEATAYEPREEMPALDPGEDAAVIEDAEDDDPGEDPAQPAAVEPAVVEPDDEPDDEPAGEGGDVAPIADPAPPVTI